MQETWGQVLEYLCLSILEYKFESTGNLLKYYLISAGVFVIILKHYSEYLYVLEYL